MSDVVQFDANAMRDQITLAIRAQVVALLPEEQLKAAVQAEIEGFLRGRDRRDYYGRPDGRDPPGMRAIVDRVLTEHITAATRDTLLSPEFTAQWADAWGTQALGEALARYVTENLTTILQTTLRAQMHAAMTQMVASMIRPNG